MRAHTKAGAWSAGTFALLVAVMLASATIGPVSISYPRVALAALEALAVPTSVVPFLGTLTLPVVGTLPWPALAIDYASPLQFAVPGTQQYIVGQLRMPRIVLGATVGAALAVSGAVMQGFFRNPMADPSIIGVSSGAAVGAVTAIAFPALLPFGVQTAAFGGALVSAFAVYLLATQNGRTPVATLLLAGVAVQTFLGAVTSFVVVKSGKSIREAMYWLMGTLNGSGWGDVEVALPAVVLGSVVLLAYARDMNVLLAGEEDAHALGVEVERTKRVLLAVSSVVTAAAVSVAGVIGFVGLVVPHAMRLVVGPDHRVLLPTSAFAGGAFLVVADTIARSNAEGLPVGIVTAFVGAPFFLYLLRDREVRAL
ncbi:vitamin B12 ABC transporter permease BtuC [Halobacterium litoreum]|uniref:Cobalamin import system permease protein BtuC n=1 Tax=Halobacterium litoreum TaxID=2039234 RepID=A0ABD5NC65_9EURY|nr:vitamin B12 ABC transporter permease BtuC [Halobacterium litoreum]UHH14612.1 vitamin B12 ABC transporter permease BtuC [Halobacterium litoreum]